MASAGAAQDPLWWTVVNAGWFSVLIGTLVGIAGLYAAWIFHQRAKPCPSLKVTFDSVLLVGPVQEAVAERLQIRFDDALVPQVASTTIGLWNDGTTIFRERDIVKKDPLRLRVKSGNVLQAILEASSRDVIDAELTIAGDQDVLISFDFLNHKTQSRFVFCIQDCRMK